MSAAVDDLARRVAAFLPVPLPSPPQQKQQLSGVAAAVLDAGGRLGRAIGDVFCRLRIDDTFYSGGVQLSPCDSRLGLANRAPLALYRPQVDEISLLTVNSSSFDPVSPAPSPC